MGIFLPRRWTRQPQGPVEVDWAHPLSRGLATTLIGGSMQAARGGLVVTTRPIAYGPTGAAFSGTSTESAGAIYVKGTESANITIDRRFSIFVVFKARSFANNPRLFNKSADGVSTNPSVRLEIWNTGVLIPGVSNWGSGGGASLNLDTRHSVFALGEPQSTTAVYFDTYIDGIFNATHSVNSASITPSSERVSWGSQTWNNGANVGTNSLNGDIEIGLFWPERRLDVDAVRSVTENPWQLFKPRRPIIYSLPGSIFTLTDTYQTFDLPIAEANAANITDYSDLRVRVESIEV